jgi:hypothetical protein
MARHDVQFEVPTRPLGKADVVFRVREDGELLGTLTVSNGSIVWFPKNRRSGHKMGWAKFDRIMAEHATRFERR